MNKALLPTRSIMLPRIGPNNAETMNGVPNICADSTSEKLYFI